MIAEHNHIFKGHATCRRVSVPADVLKDQAS